jgi:tetraacyldisaccharide 4'-kinase
MADLPGTLWFGEGTPARAGRILLAPASALYGAAVAARGALYDAGVFHAAAGAIPALSVGNLTVGGTGKTPVAAWFAAELAARGARPAIVLRGYGGDEPLVHRALNPGVPVVVDPDRVRGVARAAADGADVAVLDDAFQHRRAVRAVDVVLVSADRWPDRVRLLPAGPFRERPAALRRASLVIITAKAAGPEAIARVREVARRAAPGVPVAVLRLALGPLRNDSGGERPLASLRGAALLAISAIGDPAAFAAQLAATGAAVRPRVFPDHHAFTPAEAESIATSLAASLAELPVCTLKDYVKLSPVWPRGAPALWYVSQHSTVEDGRASLDEAIATLLRARSLHP